MIEKEFSRSTGFDTESCDDMIEFVFFGASLVWDWLFGYPLWFARFSIGVWKWFSRSSAAAGYE